MSKAILSKNEVLQQLRNIQPELGKNYGVTRIGIFGSVARNEANEGSDIDIV
ncbi:MAG TPA: nucleotidyltransferase domain-containing protein, partial [Candidatus Wallbacteria bacterium]|nr:nucleotidyltransferase domain-containing protein [Candidatus Wallbacteria bacterium]